MTPQLHPATTPLHPRLSNPRLGQAGLVQANLLKHAHQLGSLPFDRVQFGHDNNDTPPAAQGTPPSDAPGITPPKTGTPKLDAEAPSETEIASDNPSTDDSSSASDNAVAAPPLSTWGKIKATGQFLFNLPEHVRNFNKFFNSDNATLARGLFFKQVLPIIISLGAFIPVYGIPIAILGIPVSMVSGRYGTSVLNRLKTNDNAKLSEPLKNIARIDEILGSPDKATSPTEIIDRINKAIDDALDIRKFPFLNHIVKYLRPTQNNFLGRILGQWQRFALLANININVAKEESIGKAAYAGITGGFQFLFWATLVPKAGMILEKGSRFMPAPLSWICKGLGYLMEYAGLLRFAADFAGTPKPPAPQST